MPSSDLIEFHAFALALAVLIQAIAKSKDKAEDKGETERVSYPKTHKESLNKPITKITRQGIWNMVDERLEGGHYRIDRPLKTVEFYGVRIAQLEANQKPPQLR
jgi:hypothetical protein